jgi:hypothetical protein
VNTKCAASVSGCQPTHLMSPSDLMSPSTSSAASSKKSSACPANGKRFMRWRGSHYRDAAGLRRVDRDVAVAAAVLVLAACGQAPQLPNRASLPLPGEYLKHCSPFRIGAPPRISAWAVATRAPKAVKAVAVMINWRIALSLYDRSCNHPRLQVA